MAQPARRGLRAARRSGLTSPDPVRTPTAATATRTLTPAQEPRTSRRTGERQDTHARIHPGKLLRQESGRRNELPESAGGLRLSEVRPAGPCGTFSGEQTWCDNPYAEGVVLAGDAGGYDDPVAGQGLSLAMRDVRQLSELLLASADWTVAALRPYGQQRAERLRRMRRVSTTIAALTTTFTDAGRARRDRFYAASDARREDVRMALGAISRGPDRLPSEAFTDQLHESLLA